MKIETKEQAIAVYLKMVESPNSLHVWNGRIEYYSGKSRVAVAELVVSNGLDPVKITLAIHPTEIGGIFELTQSEYDDITSKEDEIAFAKSERAISELLK